MMPVRLTQRKKSCQAPVPPDKTGLSIQPPAKPPSNFIKRLPASARLSDDDLVWGIRRSRYFQLRPDDPQDASRLFGYPRRHDIRLADCTMSIFVEIVFEGTKKPGAFQVRPKLR